ncbi:hypothetical protein [Streptomyces sp. XY332]|uniref:hypothetical protein n=1 Tax=Streptomyces sp. XY332 TaxID=1415561 RepID=UPI001F430672|nr:hypothetical protein [Streptomyces sp. XY332]
MRRFPKLDEFPYMVVDFIRRLVGLPEGTRPSYAADKTAKNHRSLVRKRLGAKYHQAGARHAASAVSHTIPSSPTRPPCL